MLRTDILANVVVWAGISGLCGCAALPFKSGPVETEQAVPKERVGSNKEKFGSSKDKYHSQMSLARLSERKGQHDNATMLYSAILKKEPKNYIAHHRLAVLAGRAGRFDEAAEHFARAEEFGSDSAEFWNDRGYCDYLQEKHEEAEKHLRLALKRDPANKSARNNLGLLLGEQGKFDESLVQFKSAVGEAEAHSNLAYVKSQAGDYAGAEKHYHQALNMNNELRPAAEALLQLPQYNIAAAPRMNRSLAKSRNLPTASHGEKAGDVLKISDESDVETMPEAAESVKVAAGTNPWINKAPAEQPAQQAVQQTSYEASAQPTAAEIAAHTFQATSTVATRPTQNNYAVSMPGAHKNSLRGGSRPIPFAASGAGSGMMRDLMSHGGSRPTAATTTEPPHWQRPTWVPPGQ